MKSSLALMLALSLLVSTASADARKPADDYVRLHQWSYGNGPRVRVDKVLTDSRCPENARCIWAGEVKVAVTVKGGRWTRHLTLTQGDPVRVADGRLTLTEVLPGRRTDRAVAPRDYRFRFTFDGGL